MKKLLILFVIGFVVSCANIQEEQKALMMPVKNTIAINQNDSKDSIILKASHVVPSENQYNALKNEFIAFVHFGPNTFTRMEWGNGKEDPKIFDLKSLDTDQWCKAMKDAQMKMVILTVKHHDGFILWQSRYTKHGIMSAPFKDGKGDILKELAASCKKYGLKLGIYLSPADLYQIENKEGLYGNGSSYTKRTIPRTVSGRPFKNKTTFNFKVDDYNEYFLNQLFELLTEYGPIDEVWFDGAHPKRKGGQTYNYQAWKTLIRALAPKAVIFGKGDIRWCGNESGETRETEWNIIPYQENPNTLNHFKDITAQDIGSKEQLYKANYLHYQPAETNTSIREGWFYRDDVHQNVRSAEDVFDMYERAVGGNSIFLLNIPPNREGKFSTEDMGVLKEVGKRIRETYSEDLFNAAEGPKTVLDGKDDTFVVLDNSPQEIIIKNSKPVTLNRLVIQEVVATYGERVAKFALDAWVDNQWIEIAKATNIGYKRILRFREISTSKLRIRILENRFLPVISNVSVHYYKEDPPRLSIKRTIDGMVSIKSQKSDFGWKVHLKKTNKGKKNSYKIYYTTDGSIPNKQSSIYKSPFFLSSGEIKTISVFKKDKGTMAIKEFGPIKKNWKLLGTDSETENHRATFAFDANNSTFWTSKKGTNTHYISLDLGKKYTLKGFIYTPPNKEAIGLIEKGVIKISSDGKTWHVYEAFTFGNLINNPVTRTHFFKKNMPAQYIRIEIIKIAADKTMASIAELDFLTE